MKTYGQYCPILRASEVFAERWTPVIVRNILLGCRSFTEIRRGAPGLSRTLLAQRLRELERVGVIQRRPTPTGRGWFYEPTAAGEELWEVCEALGTWGARWLEVAPEHLDPYVCLWSMCNALDWARIPKERLVVRLSFPDRPRASSTYWLVLENGRGEVCVKSPGDEEQLVVVADSERFVRWHMGHLSWSQAASDGAIRIDGPSRLVRAFPSWNSRSHFAHIRPVASRPLAGTRRTGA